MNITTIGYRFLDFYQSASINLHVSHSCIDETMAQDQDYEIFKLGDWELQSGEKIIDAHIAYKTFGDPKYPAIVYPTWYSGCMFVPSLKLIIMNGADSGV